MVGDRDYGTGGCWHARNFWIATHQTGIVLAFLFLRRIGPFEELTNRR
jgi:hypothetical protein